MSRFFSKLSITDPFVANTPHNVAQSVHRVMNRLPAWITQTLVCGLCCAMLVGCSNTQHKNDTTAYSNKTTTQPTLTPKPPLWQQFTVGDNITIIIPADYLFEAGTDHFIEQSEPLLKEIIRLLKKYPDKNILVTAHTAGISTPDAEKKLSAQQVAQIIAYFSRHGIEDIDRQLIYAALGDTQPIADPRFAKGVAANRRIQITLFNDDTVQLNVQDPLLNE